jgi:polysaccharide export outer membrane protein
MLRTVAAKHVAAVALLATLLLSGCGASLPACPATPPSAGEYRLGVGDKIEVDVVGLPPTYQQVNGAFTIQSDGTVAVPIAGSFTAAGSSAPELADKISHALVLPSLFNQPPKVTVEVSAPQSYFVLGEVARPGSYTYRPGLNSFSAVADAGGATFRGNQDYGTLYRDGEYCTANLALTKGVAPTPIRPGDVLKVPEVVF